MIPIARVSTPKPKSKKYSYKTSYNSTRSFTPLALQPSVKTNSRLKIRKQQNQNLNSSDTLPFTNIQIKVPFAKSKDSNCNKPLDLVQYHKKESFILKKKNDILAAKINDQQKEKQLLKIQVMNLKSTYKQNNDLHNKEAAQLKLLNQQLRQKIQSQIIEINYLRSEMKSLKNDFSFRKGNNQSQLLEQVIQDKNQISRRVQYVKHYEEVLGSINKDQESCRKCQSIGREMQQERLKSSNQLRSLQNYVTFLKEKELVAEVMQKQVSSKNECIDYLRNQLQIVQTNSNHLLQVIRSLEQKVQSYSFWDKPQQSYHTYGTYKQ